MIQHGLIGVPDLIYDSKQDFQTVLLNIFEGYHYQRIPLLANIFWDYRFDFLLKEKKLF